MIHSITKTKNTLEGINNRLEEEEQRISELKDSIGEKPN